MSCEKKKLCKFISKLNKLTDSDGKIRIGCRDRRDNREGSNEFIEFISVLRSLLSFTHPRNVSTFTSTSKFMSTESVTLISVIALNGANQFYSGCLVNLNYTGTISAQSITINITTLQGKSTNIALSAQAGTQGQITFMIPSIDVTTVTTSSISLVINNVSTNALTFPLSPSPPGRPIISSVSPTMITYVPGGTANLNITLQTPYTFSHSVNISGALLSQVQEITITGGSFTSSTSLSITISFANVNTSLSANPNATVIETIFIIALAIAYVLVPSPNVATAQVSVQGVPAA
jgi:hypothetical protein